MHEVLQGEELLDHGTLNPVLQTWVVELVAHMCSKLPLSGSQGAPMLCLNLLIFEVAQHRHPHQGQQGEGLQWPAMG